MRKSTEEEYELHLYKEAISSFCDMVENYMDTQFKVDIATEVQLRNYCEEFGLIYNDNAKLMIKMELQEKIEEQIEKFRNLAVGGK